MAPAGAPGARDERRAVRVGVFCVDRASATVFGTSTLLWRVVGDVLAALGLPHAEHARLRDTYVPSWLARAWGEGLFDALGDVVLVCRPPRPRSRELLPVAAYRRGTAAPAAWSRTGEHLSVYDTPTAPVLLAFAQACTVAGGFAVTTLRPPAPGSARSDVAARALVVRSGLLPRRAPAVRPRTGGAPPVRSSPRTRGTP